ncbi:hypothetical protein [Vannielia litorea]|uniref:hypothetical protein n=1 Tax=Vannielia litorea TaxID=1217970 RepID=UPI001C94785E|nr:hypothetical protein [Vannielia litorea]MBY6047531.1 hypothetical protein [Vannielia litorea]MBY6074945.1 hypothetical protein [Vannielia litorea]
MASIEMHSTREGLRITERLGGYVLSEDGEIAAGQPMGRLLGVSLIVAGLGLLAVPMAVGLLTKLVIGVVLIIAGGIIAVRASRAPRMELDVDLEKRLLRRRRLTASGQAQLVAQWSFDSISGIDVEDDAGRGALFVQSAGRKGAVLRGAPDALREAARRIGSDLLRGRQAG